MWCIFHVCRPTPRPRPVPAPRRNIKQPPKTPEPYEEACQPSIPPKPVTSTPQVQQNTGIHRPPSSAAVAQQPATQTGIRGEVLCIEMGADLKA